jgi:hypothetical protein
MALGEAKNVCEAAGNTAGSRKGTQSMHSSTKCDDDSRVQLAATHPLRTLAARLSVCLSIEYDQTTSHRFN